MVWMVHYKLPEFGIAVRLVDAPTENSAKEIAMTSDKLELIDRIIPVVFDDNGQGPIISYME